MRNTKRPKQSGGVLLSVSVILLMTALPVAAEQVCEGFAKDKQIVKFATANAFSKEPATTVEELQALFGKYEADFRYLLDNTGLAGVAQELFEAVQSGQGISEREIVPGEQLHWMAYREAGEPKAETGLCVATRKSYAAFEIKVIADRERISGPVAEITAGRDPSDNLWVVTSGSSDSVQVTMTGPDGPQTVIASGSGETEWKGPDADPYRNSYTFTAVAEEPTVERATVYTFVVPKVCLNLALADKQTQEVRGDVARAEKTIQIEAKPAPPPSCAISVSPAEALTKQEVQVNITGHWDTRGASEAIAVEVLNASGTAVDKPVVEPPFPTTARFRRSGEYTLRATATNEIGDAATCEATVTVMHRWALRGFYNYMSPSSDEFSSVEDLPAGANAQVSIDLNSGQGFGLGLEYFFSRKLGLEIAGAFADTKGRITATLDGVRETDENTMCLATYTVGPNYHFTPNRGLDFYGGLFVGMASPGDLTWWVFGERIEGSPSTEFLFGARLGVDIPFGTTSPWAFHLGANYMDFQIGEEDVELNVDPFSVTAGLTLHF